MGSADLVLTMYVIDDLQDVIISMGMLMELGVKFRIAIPSEVDRESSRTLRVGCMCMDGDAVPIYGHDNVTWLLVDAGMKWPPTSSATSPSSTASKVSMLSSPAQDDSADSGNGQSQASQTLECEDVETTGGELVVQVDPSVSDRARRRSNLPGAATSVDRFRQMFAACAKGTDHLSKWTMDEAESGYSILTSTRTIRESVRGAFAGKSEYFEILVSVAVLTSQLRFQDYSIREYVLLVWLIEGERRIRSHSGSVYIYHDDGAFQEYRHAVTPESTLGRVKRCIADGRRAIPCSDLASRPGYPVTIQGDQRVH